MGVEQKLLAELNNLSASVPHIDFTMRAANTFRLFRLTLNGRLPLQNSSDFDEKVCVLIALTSSVVCRILRVSLFFCFSVDGGGVSDLRSQSPPHPTPTNRKTKKDADVKYGSNDR